MRILAALTVGTVLMGCVGCGSSRDYVAEGDRLASLQKYDDAILIYRKAIQNNPKSAIAYYRLGLAYNAGNHTKLALVSFQRAVALDPEFEGAQIELGNLYLGAYLVETEKDAAVYKKITAIADYLLAKNPESMAAGIIDKRGDR